MVALSEAQRIAIGVVQKVRPGSRKNPGTAPGVPARWRRRDRGRAKAKRIWDRRAAVPLPDCAARRRCARNPGCAGSRPKQGEEIPGDVSQSAARQMSISMHVGRYGSICFSMKRMRPTSPGDRDGKRAEVAGRAGLREDPAGFSLNSSSFSFRASGHGRRRSCRLIGLALKPWDCKAESRPVIEGSRPCSQAPMAWGLPWQEAQEGLRAPCVAGQHLAGLTRVLEVTAGAVRFLRPGDPPKVIVSQRRPGCCGGYTVPVGGGVVASGCSG